MSRLWRWAVVRRSKLVGAGAIGDEERDMLGGVSGRVQHLDRHIAETEQFTVPHAEEREIGGRLGKQHVLGARRVGEPTAGGNVVGMKMRIDDVANAHRQSLRRP